MLNATRRHDKLLRRYLTVTRDRAEAQLAGSPPSRIQRLAVRERALAGAVRGIRRHLDLPDTFDPELESARLGIDGKRTGLSTTQGTGASTEQPEHGGRPRITPVPSPASIARHNGEPARRDGAALAVTVSELLAFVAAHDIDPESEIVVRRLSGSHGSVAIGVVNVAFIGLTDDGRLQLDIH